MGYWSGKKILVTGGAGFLGSRIVSLLTNRGAETSNIYVPRSSDTDLTNFNNCVKSVAGINVVIHLAARVGGIGYNLTRPGYLFYQNAVMGIQMMEAARRERVEKFIAVGTVCAYPKYTRVPFNENSIWDGYPEETNAPYGLAKKMLLAQAQAYRKEYGFNGIYLLPANLYGPGDSFDPSRSHVIPALIKKFVDARAHDEAEVFLWGTGNATREFLYVDDAAEGILLAAERYNGPAPVNLGTGHEVSIRELAELISSQVDYKGRIKWDETKPDGQPRRSLDTRRAKELFGFEARTTLEAGIHSTIEYYEGSRLENRH